MDGKYCYSWNEEDYYGSFDTEAEAIGEANEDRSEADHVFIGTCTEPKLRWNSNEEDIIESIIDNLGEDVGEAAENFNISTEKELLLAKMIDDAVALWIKECEIKPSRYAVYDGHRVLLS